MVNGPHGLARYDEREFTCLVNLAGGLGMKPLVEVKSPAEVKSLVEVKPLVGVKSLVEVKPIGILLSRINSRVGHSSLADQVGHTEVAKPSADIVVAALASTFVGWPCS